MIVAGADRACGSCALNAPDVAKRNSPGLSMMLKVPGFGPTIVAMIVSEFPLAQPHLYDTQTPPVVYLSGVLMFVAGLAIVRVHNRWARDWTVLVTLAGWFSWTLGLFRMFAAGAYQQGAASTTTPVFMVLEGILLLCGIVLTLKAYTRGEIRGR